MTRCVTGRARRGFVKTIASRMYQAMTDGTSPPSLVQPTKSYELADVGCAAV